MKKKPLIGVIAPVLARVFMKDILHGAIAQLRLCGCDAVILAPLIQFESATPAHARAEREIFRMIDSPDFDAFLYLKDEATMDATVVAEIRRHLLDSRKYVMTVDEMAHPSKNAGSTRGNMDGGTTLHRKQSPEKYAAKAL